MNDHYPKVEDAASPRSAPSLVEIFSPLFSSGAPPPSPPPPPPPTAVPVGMDVASYVAGERAAYSRAFAAVLPSQQALGQLFQAVNNLQERLEADNRAVRQLQEDSVRNAARIDGIESIDLPNLQRRCDDIAARPALSPEVASALSHLRSTLVELTATQQRTLEAAVQVRDGFLMKQVKLLIDMVVGYGTRAISKADVAAVFLSRKILIGVSSSSIPHDDNNSNDTNSVKNKFRIALGSALFIGLVEGVWQVQDKMVGPRVPLSLRSAYAPLRTGLRIVRGVVWSAAFVLSANELRNLCIRAVYSPGPNRIENSSSNSTLHSADGPRRSAAAEPL